MYCNWSDEDTWPKDRPGSYVFFARAVMKICQARHPDIQWTGKLFDQGKRPLNTLPEKLDDSVDYYDLEYAHRLLTASDMYPNPSPLPPEYASEEERRRVKEWSAQREIDRENAMRYWRQCYQGLQIPFSESEYAPRAGPPPKLTKRPLPFTGDQWRWACEIVAQDRKLADDVELHRKAVRTEIEDAVSDGELVLELQESGHLKPTKHLKPDDWIRGYHAECFNHCRVRYYSKGGSPYVERDGKYMWVYVQHESLEAYLHSIRKTHAGGRPRMTEWLRDHLRDYPDAIISIPQLIRWGRKIDLSDAQVEEIRDEALDETDEATAQKWRAPGRKAKSDQNYPLPPWIVQD